MELANFVTSKTGLVHFVFSLLALVFGSLVLALPKGTVLHRRIGIAYAISMVVVLLTAFMTYRLFGGWGIFHWTAVVSSATLVAGLLPVWLRKPASYLSLHFNFMYWSVMGVYAAFVSETLVRLPKVVIDSGIPNRVFYQMTGYGTALVMGLAVFFFLRFKPQWEKQFGKKSAS